MSTGEKKPQAQPPQTSPQPPPTTPPTPQTLPKPVKNPLISRRTFLKVAVGASVILAGASMATSGQFLSPIVPEPNATPIIGNAQDLENSLGATGTGAKFFSWPWDGSVSPYYRNVLIRLPDQYITNKADLLSHFASFNTTCVHLQCLVNYKGPQDLGTSDWRLACPCHGSQYRLPDAVPVAGPAFYLGLNPLPQVTLAVDSNGNLTAVPFKPGKYFNGEVGFGRSS